jgi:hypothetical protein
MPGELEQIFRVVSQLPAEGGGLEVPIVCLDTRDEQAVMGVLRDVAASLGRDLHTWSAVHGITLANEGGKGKAVGDPLQALEIIRDAVKPAVYLLTDFHRWLNDARVSRLLKELVIEGHTARSTVVMIVSGPDLPAELKPVSALFGWPALGNEGIQARFEEVRAGLQARSGREVRIDEQERGKLLARVAGLPEGRARFEITAALMGKMGTMGKMGQ